MRIQSIVQQASQAHTEHACSTYIYISRAMYSSIGLSSNIALRTVRARRSTDNTSITNLQGERRISARQSLRTFWRFSANHRRQLHHWRLAFGFVSTCNKLHHFVIPWCTGGWDNTIYKMILPVQDLISHENFLVWDWIILGHILYFSQLTNYVWCSSYCSQKKTINMHVKQ